MSSISRTPANRLGLDYRQPQAWRYRGPLIDVHTHVRFAAHADPFFEAARRFGVGRVLSMQGVEEIDALRAKYGDAIGFIAVPRWRQFGLTDTFASQWRRDLDEFRAKGAKLCKFWVAPPMRAEHNFTLDCAFAQPIIRHAVDLGFNFMVHVGDPTAWWQGRYADTAKYGTKRDQYAQLEHLLRMVAPRYVIGAHMGGNVEDCDFLQGLMDQHSNYYIDTSATKWIVRGVADQPARVHQFVIQNQDRVLFGSDCVVEEKLDFDHYASRYWCQRTMWETNYRGESPIEDPDADPPLLSGVDLPADVLEKVCRRNAERLGLG